MTRQQHVSERHVPKRWWQAVAATMLLLGLLVTVSSMSSTSAIFAHNLDDARPGHLNPASGATASLPWPTLTITPLIESGLRQPVHLTNAGDGSGRLFVVEKAGRIRIIKDGTLLETPFLDINEQVGSEGECGMLSVAFPPDFTTEGVFYVYYTYDTDEWGDLVQPALENEPNGGCDTVVARFRVSSDPDVADKGSEERILLVNQPYNNHNGGQLAFDPAGKLMVGLGDGGSGGDPHDLAQNRASLLGKVLRLEVTASGPYAVPADNPFVGIAGMRPEIWASGLRNPWRFSFDAAHGTLFIADVGQNAYEEVNAQPASSGGGENYGWDRLEGTHCYPQTAACDPAGTVLPVAEYDHAEGQSITGGFVYRGQSFPDLTGIYLYGDYVSGRIWGLRSAEDGWENTLLLRSELSYALASFGVDEAGELYLVDIRGAIHRIGARPAAETLREQIYLPLIQR